MTKGKPNTWNEFQQATKGQYGSRKDAADAYHEIVNLQSPWPLNYTPTNTVLKPGGTFEMALSPGQSTSRPGGFGTFDNITDVSYVRNELAVKQAWKPQIDRVVTYEIIKPLPANIGPVGAQVDKVVKKLLPGGGSQLEMLVSPADRMQYLKVVSVRPI